MHVIRQFGRLAATVLAVAITFGTTSLHAKEYTILLKESVGGNILGAGVFDWDPGTATVNFPAELTLTFDNPPGPPVTETYTFNFVGATVVSEDDHVDCVNPDAAPEAKICPSRIRAVLGSATAAEVPVDLTLADNGNPDDRIGNWSFGLLPGSTFITSDAESIPTPAPALLFLAGLPVLALVRRRLRRSRAVSTG